MLLAHSKKMIQQECSV